jgi:hypothetical protein
MLDMCGQLLSVAFGLRLLNAQQTQLGTATAGYLALFALMGVLSSFGLPPGELLSMDGKLVHEDLQLWRVVSAFFWIDGIGTSFAMQLWIFGVYSSLLESQHFAVDDDHFALIRYATVLGAGAVQILIFAAALGTSTMLSLAHPLCFYVVGLWSRSDPNKSFELFQLGSVRAAFVPWCLLAMCVPLTGMEQATYNVVGVGAALAYDLAVGLPALSMDASLRPSSSGTHKQRSSSSSSSKSGKAAPSKVAPAGRERWMRWAYVGGALLLVAYHGTTRAAERRAERSAESRTSRLLRDALKAHTPRMSQLLTKFAESRRTTSTVTADAETILSAWTFAVEHWQQALAQRRSQIDVNNISAADPEVTRQAVAQALGRTEVPEDMADADVVAEVYSLMGLNRLLVTPETYPYFVTAVRAHREQRKRTLAAWNVIKRLVYEAEEGDDGSGSGTGRITECCCRFGPQYDRKAKTWKACTSQGVRCVCERERSRLRAFARANKLSRELVCVRAS